jgi:FolB domain-containing protein
MTHSDAIRIQSLEVDCIVGIYPGETDTPQPLVVDLEMRLETTKAAVRDQLRYSVNYSAVAAQVAFLLRNCRFRLLETAAHALCHYLLLPPALGESRPQVDHVRVCLSKPGGLPSRAVPSLEIERDTAWLELDRRKKTFGFIDVVYEGRDVGIYRVDVAPGASLVLLPSVNGRAAEMALTGGLACQDRKVRAGTARQRQPVATVTYANPTERHQTILCVDARSFANDRD